jgi:hypothetical protein
MLVSAAVSAHGTRFYVNVTSEIRETQCDRPVTMSSDLAESIIRRVNGRAKKRSRDYRKLSFGNAARNNYLEYQLLIGAKKRSQPAVLLATDIKDEKFTARFIADMSRVTIPAGLVPDCNNGKVTIRTTYVFDRISLDLEKHERRERSRPLCYAAAISGGLISSVLLAFLAF